MKTTSPMNSKQNHKQSIKELIRHLLHVSGCTVLLDGLKKVKGYKTLHLSHPDRASIFNSIYESGAWIHQENQESFSGRGSSLAVTSNIRRSLPSLMEELNVKMLVDIGCGDWTWMSKTGLNCKYIGVDIVKKVVDANLSRFANKNISFICLDAVSQEIPSCDAVLCREVIFHLSFSDGKALLRNIKNHSKWLIVTSDSSIWFNSDIKTGDFRMLNLQCRPFMFPPPERIVSDDGLVGGRILGVWNTSLISD